MQNFFGKLTISPSYHARARNLLCEFWNRVLPGPSHRARPRGDLQVTNRDMASGAFDQVKSVDAHYKHLQARLKHWGVTIPPLMNSYLGLTNKIESFGATVNSNFGNAFETLFLLPIRDIHPKRRRQFIDSYAAINPNLF